MKQHKNCTLAQTRAFYDRQVASGAAPMSLDEVRRHVNQLGYRMERSFAYNNDYNRPECWRATHYSIVDKKTGLSFAHVDARRDRRFNALQELRSVAIVLHHGRVVEF